MFPKWTIMILAFWLCVVITFNQLLAQTVTVLDVDQVRETVTRGEGTFVSLAIPARYEHGLLYAPLRINVLITNSIDISVAQTNIFADSRFLTDIAFHEATQGMHEISIRYDHRALDCGPNKTTACIRRGGRYIQVYNDHVFVPANGFHTNLVGRWTERDFGEGRKYRLIVSTDGKFQLETYFYDPAGHVNGRKGDGRLWATPSRLILCHSAGRVQLFELSLSTDSLIMREIGTQSFGGLTYAFTKETVESLDPK